MDKKLCIIARMSDVKSASDGRNYRTLGVQEMPYEVIFNPMTGKQESVPMTRTPLVTGFNVWEQNINGSINPVFNAYKVNQAIVGSIEKVITEPYLLIDDQGDVVAATATTVFVNWDSTDTIGYAKQLELELKNSGRTPAEVAATPEELASFLAVNKEAFLISLKNKQTEKEAMSALDVVDAHDLDALSAAAEEVEEEDAPKAPTTPTGKSSKANATATTENLAD